MKYAGEYYDEESGLYYLRARYYDPSIGRFISMDSYEGDITNPLSLNLYTYVENDPLSYVDPSGHSLIGVVISIGSSILANVASSIYSSSKKSRGSSGSVSSIRFGSSGGLGSRGVLVCSSDWDLEDWTNMHAHGHDYAFSIW